jgi:hypothetical protein
MRYPRDMAQRELAKEKSETVDDVATAGREGEVESNTRFSSHGNVPGVADKSTQPQSSASELAYTEDKPRSAGVKMKTVYVDRAKRFSLDVDQNSGRAFLSIPVRNKMVEYDEWYEIDQETFERFKANPTLAHSMVDQAKRREIDHLLLYQPGADRGVPD